MCDTLIALGNSTLDGSVIFGKNSDRPFDEVQLITYNPRMKFSKGEELKCTYISIPQASETAAILLSQPWWMWGAEMGTNEYGVVIGNEAVYTHEPLRKIGLLGMDLLRLGLERGKTAEMAMNIIIELLEKFGQGGGCDYNDPGWMYHNSFIIADPKVAFVLETADKWWITEKIEDVRSISNEISIRGKGDKRREGLIQHAIEKNYCKNEDEFDFALTYSGSHISSIPIPYSRGGKATLLLNEDKGNITSDKMMSYLREHQTGICMHGLFESTGSQVSHLREGKESIHWFTGTALPCISIYKPYTFPIKEQIHYKPGPYLNIDSQWAWSKYNISKAKKNIKDLRSIENCLITKVTQLINQKDNISKEVFLKNIISLNLEAWNNL